MARQAGFLDCGCDVGACDVGACDVGACDLPVGDIVGSACSCPGDCSWKRRRTSDPDQYVVIPSRGNVRN